MFKPSLGLGTKLGAAANKSDLTTYLKTLKKKQKELTRRHSLSHENKEQEKGQQHESKDQTDEDSDLASLAREFRDQEEEDMLADSPFIRRPPEPSSKKSSGGDTATPLPDKDVPFISSFQSSSQPKKPEDTFGSFGSSALDNFVKFDRKYGLKAQHMRPDDSETETESEPLMSPVKIVSQLEEKVLASTSKTESSGRLKRQAEQAGLRLTLPGRASKSGTVAESTASEVSDHLGADLTPRSPRTPKSPRSPLFTLENLHDIEELMEDKVVEQQPPNLEAKKVPTLFSFDKPIVTLLNDQEQEDDKEEEKEEVVEEVIEIDLSEPEQDKSSITVVESIKVDNDVLLRAKSEQKAGKSSKSSSKSSEKSKSSSKRKSKDTFKEDVAANKETVEKQHSKEKSRRRKRSSSRRHRRSCFYCQQLCDYHRHEVVSSKKKDRMVNESVQVGPANARSYGGGHYMFDPTLDALYNDNRHASSSVGAEQLAFIRSAWTNEVETASAQVFASTVQLDGGPMAVALSELLKGQLELTAHFLSSQKSMYATYCASLEKIVRPQEVQADKIVEARIHNTAILETSSVKSSPVKTEVSSSKSEDDHTSAILEEYESEFESESSEEEDTLIPTEISKTS